MQRLIQWMKSAGCVTALLLVAASWAAADGPCPLPLPTGTLWVRGTLNGLLQEETERVVIRDGERKARAKEQGAFFGGCGSLTLLEGRVYIRAESLTPLTLDGLGIGDFTGTLHIQPDHGARRVGGGSFKGVVTGELDFRPTNSTATACSGNPCPWVWASGTRMITGTQAVGGRFTGVALVPFACAAAATGWCYLDPTGFLTGTPFDLVEAVLSDLNGGPEAKFLVTLYQ
jgi:hypothetical protein